MICLTCLTCLMRQKRTDETMSHLSHLSIDSETKRQNESVATWQAHGTTLCPLKGSS